MGTTTEIDKSPFSSHPLDADITFDERRHVYTVWTGGGGGGRREIGASVTSVVGGYFPKFDAQNVATAMVSSSGFPFGQRRSAYWNLPLFAGDRTLLHLRAASPSLPDSGFAHLRKPVRDLVAVVTAHWDANGKQAARLGTGMHADIERHYKNLPFANTTPEFRHFLVYAGTLEASDWVPFRIEQRVWDDKFDVAGTVDAVFARREHMLMPAGDRPVPLPVRVVDWKRSKDIRFAAFADECGSGHAASVPNANGWKYCLQLAVYAEILERNYGVKVVEESFVVFHPDNLCYVEYDARRIGLSSGIALREIAGSMLESRSLAC